MLHTKPYEMDLLSHTDYLLGRDVIDAVVARRR
jgi:hypothetical protein